MFEADLRTSDLAPLEDGADLVFHKAGQPGVRASWQGFGDHLGHNVLATQRSLDRRPAQPGDVRATSGSTALAAETLGWRPRVSLRVGVAEQVAWHASRNRLERSA
ncbi:MAG TPA: hypothetical protein VMR89_05840 [Actinomycetota bacterium]|nr:hypothetical protein [Actinomycetota bacterium]